MRSIVASSLLVLCLYATGCSRSGEAPTPPAAEPEAAVPPVSEPAPSAATEPAVNNGHDYTCEDGVKLNAKIDNGTIVLTVDGKAQTLKPTEGAYGANYSGEGVTFIAQGEHAMLARDGQKPSNCTAQ
jgi:membrane-bound inhibitor of C-type lysozyme